MSTIVPVATVRVIVENDEGQVLILRRPENSHGAGGWCLPGGKVDFGDTVEDTVAKELFEETELTCTEASFLFYQDSVPSDESEMHVINFYFECKFEGEVRINDESSEFAWIANDETERYQMVFLNGHGIRRYWCMDRDERVGLRR